MARGGAWLRGNAEQWGRGQTVTKPPLWGFCCLNSGLASAHACSMALLP